MIVDAHMHIGFHGETPLLSPSRCTPEDLISWLDANQVDKAVCVPFWRGVTPADYAASNDYVAEAQANYPDRIIGFGWVNPAHGVDVCLRELDRIIELGLQGLGELHPYQGGYYVNLPYVYPIIERAAEFDLPLIIHSDFGCRFSSPLRIILLAQDIPAAKIIMAHMGMDSIQMEQLPGMVMRCNNIWLESSATPPYPHYIEHAIRVLGADRVIFGSDNMSLELALKKAALCALNDDERALYLGQNILRLLPRHASRKE